MATYLAGHGPSQSRVQLNQLLETMESNEILRESYEAASAALLALQAEDQGMVAINVINNEEGFTLKNLQELSKMADLQTDTGPLLKRGLTLRTENVFNKGINFDGAKNLAPRFQKIIDKPSTQRQLFEADAFARNERELFTTGNLFMAYRQSTQTFFPISIHEISNFASNADTKDDVWYYQRTYTKIDPATNKPATSGPTIEWYPVLERWENRKSAPLLKNIDNKPVVEDVVIVDLKVNTKIDKVWGVPDCLPAMPYAWAHQEYIKDASKLLKALATIAWKVVARSKGNAANAAGKVNIRKTAASTAVMTEGTDLTAMPRAGQVNMRDGQAIAGYVASALGVSLIALLSDPGTASGSYGAAATLDGPSANSARARQALWINFYQRIYRLIGVSKGTEKGQISISFPKLNEDPLFRQIQTVTLARATGGLWADEYRDYVLSSMDITSLHDDSPATEDYAQAQNALGYLSMLQAAETAQAAQAAAASGDVNSAQGKSGVVGDTSRGDNTNRNADKTAART